MNKPKPIFKTKTRNWVAVAAHFKSGAGAHGKTKYSRKTKHKNKDW